MDSVESAKDIPSFIESFKAMIIFLSYFRTSFTKFQISTIVVKDHFLELLLLLVSFTDGAFANENEKVHKSVMCSREDGFNTDLNITEAHCVSAVSRKLFV